MGLKKKKTKEKIIELEKELLFLRESITNLNNKIEKLTINVQKKSSTDDIIHEWLYGAQNAEK